ncbi:MAG: hypothetical protein K2X32_09075, partial [Phycisphaerales bacterium]|nr:hypothetical protein [Phycisphaerales bacterium]
MRTSAHRSRRVLPLAIGALCFLTAAGANAGTAPPDAPSGAGAPATAASPVPASPPVYAALDPRNREALDAAKPL